MDTNGADDAQRATAFLRRLRSLTKRRGIAIDLGTSKTAIDDSQGRPLLRQPTVVAIEDKGRRVRAIGEEAAAMIGRTPPSIRVVEPVRNGAIAELAVAEAMLRYVLRRFTGRPPRRVEIALGVPSSVSPVARRALREAVEMPGARRIHLIEQLLAAAVGAGIDIEAARGHLIVDIGGGKTEAGIVALGGLQEVRSTPIAGNTFDDAVRRHLRRAHDLLIGTQTARMLKHELGTALAGGDVRKLEVRGRHTLTGLPTAVEVNSCDLHEGAIADGLETLLRAIGRVLERAPAELSADLTETGVVLTGGGALLHGLDRLIERRTGLPVRVADAPQDAVVRGCAALLRREELLARVTG